MDDKTMGRPHGSCGGVVIPWGNSSIYWVVDMHGSKRTAYCNMVRLMWYGKCKARQCLDSYSSVG